MPSFFPGAHEQDAAAMALPARVCGGNLSQLSILLSGTAPGFSTSAKQAFTMGASVGIIDL